MKVQIRKYELGGGALPFVDYMPFEGIGSSDTTEKPSTENDSSKIGLKDLLTLTKELDGLPNDVRSITSSLQNMYEEATLFNNGEISTDNIVNTYLSALQKIQVAKFNKDQFNLAQNTVISNGGLGEIAIDESGRLLVVDNDSGNLGRLSLEEFKYLQKSNPGKFSALTNSMLLQQRAEDENFTFQNNILRTVSNGIGTKKVTELLLQVASSLGKDSLQREGYTDKTSTKILNGMGILEQAYEQGMTVDGLYKQGYINENQANQAQAAIEYLWASLPENAKVFLGYKSGAPTVEGGKELIAQLLFAKIDSTNKYTQTLVKDPNDSTTSGGGLLNDFLSNIQAGTKGRDATMHVNLGGKYADVGMSVSGTAYGMAMSIDGKPIDRTSMLDMLQSTGIWGITEGSNNVFFGDQRMTTDTLRNIAYTGDEILRVNIPIKEDGSPDFELLKVYNDAEQEFLLSNKTDEDRLRIFGKNEKLASLLNADGTLNMRRFAPYLLVNGLTTDKLAGVEKTNDYVKEVDANPNLYQTLKLSLASGTVSKPVYPDIDELNWHEKITKGWAEWLDGYDKLYKGVVYIPISMNRGSAAMYSNQKINGKESEQMELEYQQNNAFLNYNFNGNSAALLNM